MIYRSQLQLAVYQKGKMDSPFITPLCLTPATTGEQGLQTPQKRVQHQTMPKSRRPAPASPCEWRGYMSLFFLYDSTTWWTSAKHHLPLGFFEAQLHAPAFFSETIFS
jgi:hypothetical protein